jgi:hypothetical protein
MLTNMTHIMIFIESSLNWEIGSFSQTLLYILAFSFLVILNGSYFIQSYGTISLNILIDVV